MNNTLPIIRRSLKGLDEEDYRRLVRGEIQRIQNLAPDIAAFVLPCVTVETVAGSLEDLKQLVVCARRELNNWHRQESRRFGGAGKHQQANRRRDPEEFLICVAGILIVNREIRHFASFEQSLKRSPDTHRKV